MRVGMFATPVFWGAADGDPIRTALYYWNPFTYFLAIVREPIVNGNAPLSSLWVCLAITLAMWLGAVFLLGVFRRKVALIV